VPRPCNTPILDSMGVLHGRGVETKNRPAIRGAIFFG